MAEEREMQYSLISMLDKEQKTKHQILQEVDAALHGNAAWVKEGLKAGEKIKKTSRLPQGTTTALPYKTIKIHLPALAKQIETALAHANSYSVLDKTINLPDKVVLSEANRGSMGYNPIYNRLYIGENALTASTMSEILSLLEHEFGHELEHHQHGDDFDNVLEHYQAHNPAVQRACESTSTMEKLEHCSNASNRHEEYVADRTADARGYIKRALTYVTNKKENYDYDSTDETHPNDRERISRLLEERYANGIFQGNVELVNGKFIPNSLSKMKDAGHLTPDTPPEGRMEKVKYYVSKVIGKHYISPEIEQCEQHLKPEASQHPLTEDLRMVTNWQELNQRANQQVSADIQYLDLLVESRNGLTQAEKEEFMQRIDLFVADFKKHHPPVYDDNFKACVSGHGLPEETTKKPSQSRNI